MMKPLIVYCVASLYVANLHGHLSPELAGHCFHSRSAASIALTKSASSIIPAFTSAHGAEIANTGRLCLIDAEAFCRWDGASFKYEAGWPLYALLMSDEPVSYRGSMIYFDRVHALFHHLLHFLRRGITSLRTTQFVVILFATLAGSSHNICRASPNTLMIRANRRRLMPQCSCTIATGLLHSCQWCDALSWRQRYRYFAGELKAYQGALLPSS